MAKFYLHMESGELLGKVTKLRYIDDVSDDELTIYVFEDNTKCDETYIAEVNCMEAFNGRYVMTELSDPNNKWVFETKTFNLNESKKVIGDDGIEYELPAAGIGRNGEHVSLIVTPDGNTVAKTLANSGKRTDSKPPYVVKLKNPEPKENYLLSLHPELLTGKNVANTGSTNATTDSSVIIIGAKTQKDITPVNQQQKQPAVHNNNTVQNNYSATSPISTNVVETIRHANISINLDDIKNSSEYKGVYVTINGETNEISIEEFISRLTSESFNLNIKDKAEIEVSPYDDPSFTEDVLVANMIDKSKKKVYTIGIDVDMELPPREVYKTLKEVYPDGMAQHFVTCISKRMNNTALKESVAAGLTAYYDSTLTDDKNE